MKTVKVYGPGCKRCETTEAMVKEAAESPGRGCRGRKGHRSQVHRHGGRHVHARDLDRRETGSCRRPAGWRKTRRLADGLTVRAAQSTWTGQIGLLTQEPARISTCAGISSGTPASRRALHRLAATSACTTGDAHIHRLTAKASQPSFGSGLCAVVFLFGELAMVRARGFVIAFALLPLSVSADETAQGQVIWTSSCARCHKSASSLLQRMPKKDANARAIYLDTFLPNHHLTDPVQQSEPISWLIAQNSE